MNATTFGSAASGPAAPSPSSAGVQTPRSLWVIRIAGLFQIVTGLLFWTGNAYPLIPLHMLSGLIVVVTLWAIAISAARRGASALAVTGAIAYGLFVVAFGVMQGAILRGDLHWIVQLAHLLVGIAAIGMAHALVRSGR